MQNSVIRVGLFCRVLPQYRLAIYERLAKQPGIDLTVLYSKEPPYYSLKTVHPNGRFKAELIPMRSWRMGNRELLYHTTARRIISSGRFDVVILPGNPRLLSNFPALWAARRHGTGVVWWSLGFMANQSAITLAIRRLLMRIPEAVVLYTEREQEHFLRAGIPEDKVFVAQNTIDVSGCLQEAAKWSPDRLREFARDNGLAGKKVILYCSRLTAWKRLDLLIRALDKLPTSAPEYRLLVIGAGPKEQNYRALAAELHVDSQIGWVGAIYGQQQLAPWFLSADVLVMPEALGLTIFHSFAYGLPVITCDDCKCQGPEYAAMRNGDNGLLYKRGDVDALTASISRICADPTLRSRLSCNARQTVLTEYTPEKMVNGLVHAIRHAQGMASRK